MTEGNRLPSMTKISSGIRNLDTLVDFLHIGDNVVWEVDAGTAYEAFIQSFIRHSFADAQKVIYVSFNRSPQSILNEIGNSLRHEHFTLIDCFTSGKGKNDNTFLRFYENPSKVRVMRILNPKAIEEFTQTLNSIEDSLPPGARYVFDSLTGMQDLWGDEDDTYRFFTHMCPRLYDLDTVAYWILEKDAHSQKFKANLRHITQVVLDLYKRREHLYIKALKLSGRQDREAFKPHLYEIKGDMISIISPRKELSHAIGTRIRELRTRMGMSQKELADKVELTPSFMSQLENSQISPSLNSFLQICNVLGVNPGVFFGDRRPDANPWLFKGETIMSTPVSAVDGIRLHQILSDENLSAKMAVLPPDTSLKGHFLSQKDPEFIYVVHGELYVSVEGRTERVQSGDCIYLKESSPSQWKNEGGDEASLLVVW